MADISIRQTHLLTARKARAAAETVAGEMASQFDLALDWQGNVLNFKRGGVVGTLTLLEREARLDITLGFMLKAFAARIEEQVGKNMVRVFTAAPSA